MRVFEGEPACGSPEFAARSLGPSLALGALIPWFALRGGFPIDVAHPVLVSRGDLLPDKAAVFLDHFQSLLSARGLAGRIDFVFEVH